MNANDLTARLANLSDDETRCDLSDYAVNTLRDLAGSGKIAKGHGRATRADLGALVVGEARRIADLGIALDETGLVPYLRARRPGSPFRLNRATRALVFAVIATRAAR